jgi:hypothetical protein
MVEWRLAILALPILLTGCLISDEPLFSARDYAYPLRAQSYGDVYTYDDKQGWHNDHRFGLRRAGAEYLLDENNESTPFVLTQIGEDQWLAQSGNSNGQYQYAILVHGDDDRYYAYDLGDLCDALGDNGDIADDIRADGSDCKAGSLSGLLRAIDNYLPANAQPYAYYVFD